MAKLQWVLCWTHGAEETTSPHIVCDSKEEAEGVLRDHKAANYRRLATVMASKLCPSCGYDGAEFGTPWDTDGFGPITCAGWSFPLAAADRTGSDDD